MWSLLPGLSKAVLSGEPLLLFGSDSLVGSVLAVG
jgi:hypothetical protein